MVRGLDRFREHFAGYADRYVLIGGTAASLTMAEAGLPFRSTKDLDILLIVEAVDGAFGDLMWRFIEQGSYEIRRASDGEPRLYRFEKPGDAAFPFMIELFSRKPDGFLLRNDAHLTPLPMDGTVDSLSAILLDDAYYDFVMQGRREEVELSWIEADRLIPLKASAWLDLTAREAAGEKVDKRDIRKHLNDVFRLSQVLSARTRIVLPGRVREQFKEFLTRAVQESVDLKQLRVVGPGQAHILARLGTIYGVSFP
ncbi:hypothetical protein ACW7G2_13260 [Luteimonas sp. A277]